MNITLVLNSIFIMLIEYNKNYDITTIRNCKISGFNKPDNRVYSSMQYVDSFGISFISAAIRGCECGFTNCSHNLCSIPNYYLSYPGWRFCNRRPLASQECLKCLVFHQIYYRVLLRSQARLI